MRIFFFIPVVASFLVFISSEPAFALQTHRAPEGLYTHQLAHLFFVVCMGNFVYRIHRSWLPEQHEWKYFVLGGILLMVWNLWAFAGHFISLLVSEKNFILPQGALVPLLRITSWKEILYYILHMDHLLCVPALICFYLGLRKILNMLSRQSTMDTNRSE